MGIKLRVINFFDPWRSKLCTCPLKFNLNPYTGCGHHCIYCYARTYIRDFDRPRPKKDLIRNLVKDLSRLPKNALISMSNSSDPYTPPEDRTSLTRRALKLLIEGKHPILIITKSDLVVRDVDILSNGSTVVSITITTNDDNLSKTLEPNAPPATKRLRALEKLISNNIITTVRIDPIIPYVNDDLNMLRGLIKELSGIGVVQITASTLKVRGDILNRVCSAFPEVASRLRNLYTKGKRLGNYIYLPRDLRLKYLLTLRDLCYNEGLAFTVCREAFQISTPGIACDGSTYILK
ncbi:MAG: radical SAM protein [Sulfolobales archaeon]